MSKHITLLFIFIFPFITISQENEVDKANKKFDRMDYIDSQKVYLAVAEKGYSSQELLNRLAKSYYFNANYSEAAQWYKRLFEEYPEPNSVLDLLRYSQSLRATGNDSLAKIFYDKYVKRNNVQKNHLTAEEYLKLIEKNSERFTIKPIEKLFDKNQISFGHTKVGNTLVYASTLENNSLFKRKSKWDGLSFLSLYEVDVDENNQAVSDPKVLKGKWKNKFHESSAAFTKDGNTLYFTKSNSTPSNKRENQNLKIYRSTKKDGKWQQPVDLSINSDLYSTAHPALNPTEDTLYFSSDRPGGFGQSDLYRVEIKEDGTLGEVKNLGPKINTQGKESFPFISSNNELYFSSDGHFGLGGMDVFYVKITSNGFHNLLNVGRPINSYADDFSFGIDSLLQKGFISSNRSVGPGEFVKDNIYTFTQNSPIVDYLASIIEGKVTDKTTENEIHNALVVLKNESGKVISKTYTDPEGRYELEAKIEEQYIVQVSKNGYDIEEKQSMVGKERQKLDFQLQPNIANIDQGIDLAKVLNIPKIYFDYDKYAIRQDARVDLEKIVTVLETHPSINMKIVSHTDSRGSDEYNLYLSQKRSNSVLRYLTGKGIDSKRLMAIGMGERSLVNHCTDGVTCSEQEHEQNRRSEFIIVEPSSSNE